MKGKFTLFTIHKVRNNDVSSLQNKVKAFERAVLDAILMGLNVEYLTDSLHVISSHESSLAVC